MQPERITVQKALNQQRENFAPSTIKLSAGQAPFREVTTSFTPRDFAATDLAVEEFGAGDFASMDYALPDVMDSRVFRLIGAKASNGAMSSRPSSFYQVGKRGLDMSVAFILLLLASPVLLVIA